MIHPFDELRALVRDHIAYRVLKSYCEKRRHGSTTVDEAATALVAGIKANGVAFALAEATKPEPIWREEVALSQAVVRAVSPYRGHAPSEGTLEAIRAVVEHECARRYPKHARRYVRRVVRACVAFSLLRLEIKVPQLVASLSGLRS